MAVWKDSFSAEVIKQIYLHHVEFTASTVPELPEELSGFHFDILNQHQVWLLRVRPRKPERAEWHYL